MTKSTGMPPKRPEILFVYTDLGDGGIQRFLSLLSKELVVNNSYRVSLALFRNVQLYPFSGEIFDLDCPTSTNKIIVLKNFFLRIIRLRKILKKRQFDLLFSSSYIANSVCLLLKLFTRIKIPLIISFHSPYLDKTNDMGIVGKFVDFTFLKLHHLSQHIVVVSNGISEELIRKGINKEKITVISNPIDISQIKKLSMVDVDNKYNPFLESGKPLLISAGRLSPEKNYKFLLDVLKKVREKIDCNLIILGEGSERSILERYAINLNIREHFFLPGWVENPFNIISHADVFLLSSLWEGFGNVIIEAMCCGVPVVSFDCPTGPRDIINHLENGYLIKMNDMDDFCMKTINILTNKRLSAKLSKRGEERIKSFDTSIVIREYKRLFLKAINEKAAWGKN